MNRGGAGNGNNGNNGGNNGNGNGNNGNGNNNGGNNGGNNDNNNNNNNGGNDTNNDTPSNDCPSVPPVSTLPSTGGNNGNNLQLQNAQDAQALNAKFQTLTANSGCESGENACIGTAFAQCVNGKFVTTNCAGGLTCAALPLVNSRGTSITCTTQSDAIDRITRTGATGGLTGSN